MRILLLSHFANYWTRPYAEHFARSGHDVFVVGFDRGEIPGIKTASVGIDPWQRHKYGYVTRVPAFARMTREFQPDVVVAAYVTSNGLTATLSWRGPLVVSAHGTDLFDDHSEIAPKLWLRRRLAEFVLRRATLVHVVSQEMADVAASLGAKPARIVSIPVGIDPTQFEPRASGRRPGPVRILCTRRHEALYNNETIIEALARLSGECTFEATFVGNGHLTREYVQLAKTSGLDGLVRFLPAVPPEAVPALLQDADIYVSASLVDGTSSALLEAMATGLIPVVSKIPANEAWLDDGITGLLFEPKDPESLAQALKTAIEDQNLANRARTRNRGRVEQDGDLHANLRRLESAVVRAVELGSLQPARS